MKRGMISLCLFIVIISVSYYIFFVKGKKVSNDKLLKVRNQITGIVVSTMESSKYISDYDLVFANDTTVSINVYTTSIYNVFASKTPEINIPLDEKVKKLIIMGKTIERDKLQSDK